MRLLGGGLRKYGAVSPLIGVLPWGILDSAVRDRLRSAHSQKRVTPVVPGNNPHQVGLEPHHSHFVLANDPKEQCVGEAAWGREIPLRLALEERLHRYWKVPRLLVAVQGSRGCAAASPRGRIHTHRARARSRLGSGSRPCGMSIPTNVDPHSKRSSAGSPPAGSALPRSRQHLREHRAGDDSGSQEDACSERGASSEPAWRWCP